MPPKEKLNAEQVATLTSWVKMGAPWPEALRRSHGRGLLDPVPGWVLDRFDLVTRPEAFAGIHAPDSMAHKEVARRRLVLDELLRVQLALVQRKRHIERTTQGIAHRLDGPLVDAFVARLPFDLTDDQRAAIHEIGRDLAAPHPMHRLLQGDVGSGKTVVALLAMLTASGLTLLTPYLIKLAIDHHILVGDWAGLGRMALLFLLTLVALYLLRVGQVLFPHARPLAPRRGRSTGRRSRSGASRRCGRARTNWSASDP